MARRADDLNHRDGRMERKHTLMPPRLIRHVESMAADAKVPFREIVRRTLWSYNLASDKDDSDPILERLAEALIESNKKTIAYLDLDTVNKKLDETHAVLAKRRHDVAG